MNWFIFAIIGILSISIANIIQRAMMREPESDPLGSSIIFQFIVAFITGVFALFKGFVPPPFAEFPFNFVFSAVFYALGTLALFNAAKKIGASEITILSACGAIVTIVAAVFFLGESFSIKQVLGTALILASVILVQSKLKISKNLGSLYAILGTSCYALAIVSDTYILRGYDAVSYTPIISFLPGVVLLLAKPSVVGRLKSFINVKYLRNMLLYGFLYGIQAVAYYLALSAGANASQMAPIFKSTIILTVILAALFLKEKEKIGIKLFSALLVTAGVILVK
ncbi:MAG: DMT family transporter [bacterium]|nr:DMT family transporter [bacterium]